MSAVLIAALTLAATCLSGCRSAPSQANGPKATPFLHYLRRSDASMVAYTSGSAPEQELSLLRQKFNGLVLYGFDQKTSEVLELAAKLKYEAVLATIWDPRSDDEVRKAAELLSKYGDRLAIAVSLGSEGLLEQRYSLSHIEASAASLDRYASRIFEKTTSEPWWRYLDGQPSARELRNFGDFVTVHVHVVWDADIVNPVEAARWSRDRAAEIVNVSGRPVLVREAGFPGSGRSPRPSNEGLTFTREAQAEFWREWVSIRRRPDPGASAFLSMAAAFEAIDNPAKTWRDFESSWGLLSPNGLQPYLAWDAFPDLQSAR